MSIEGDRYAGGLFSPSQQIAASQLNDLAAAAARANQYYSSSSLVAQGSFGTVDLGGPQITSQEYDFPFKVSVMEADGNEKKVTVRPGTVNNIVPKISGAYLDGPTTPTLNFSSVSSTKKKIVALKVTKSGATFFPNTVEVVLRDDDEALAPTDNEGYLQIASITCQNDGGDLRVTGVYQYTYASQIVARTKPGLSTAQWLFSSR